MSARSTDPLPAFVAPQLASLVAEPPAGKDWLHEIKYDGYRAIAAIGAGGRCRIYTRSGQDWTDKFAGIAAELTELKVGSALLDGEIVVLDEHGRTSFQRLQNALKEGRTPLTYYVFDILELDGHDLRQEPLSAARKSYASPRRRAEGDPLQRGDGRAGRQSSGAGLPPRTGRHRLQAG